MNGMKFFIEDHNEITDWTCITINVEKDYPHYTTTSYSIYQGRPEWFVLDKKRQQILIRKNARALQQVRELSHATGPALPENAMGLVGSFLTGRKPKNTITNSIATLKKNHNNLDKNGGARNGTRKVRYLANQ
jgi:hypothetical protein